MYVAKIRTAAAAAAVVLAHSSSVGAFMVGGPAPPRGGGFRVAGVAGSVCHVNNQIVGAGAKFRSCCGSIGRGIDRSSFCSRQVQAPAALSPSSRPRQDAVRGLGRRRGRGTLSMKASGEGGRKGESTRNRILGTVVRYSLLLVVLVKCKIYFAYCVCNKYYSIVAAL